MRFFQNQQGSVTLYILGLVIIASFLLVGGFAKQRSSNDGSYKTKRANFADRQNVADNRSLQLYDPVITVLPTVPLPTRPTTPSPTLPGSGTPPPGTTNTPTPITDPPRGIPTPTPRRTAAPTPGGSVCSANQDPLTAGCTCPRYPPSVPGWRFPGGGGCHDNPATGQNDCAGGILEGDCGARDPADPRFRCTRGCVEKPIIYLYPETETLVNVSVVSEGEVVVSDPYYPKEGWKNVLAYPSGDLLYKGKQYRELFFETSVAHIKQPATGFVISAHQVKHVLNIIAQKYGLTEFEKNEFVSYWVSRVATVGSAYFFVSVINEDEKARIDTLIVNPEPDTRIEFLAYIKPLPYPIAVKPFVFPPTKQRVGFTLIEWGGYLAQ